MGTWENIPVAQSKFDAIPVAEKTSTFDSIPVVEEKPFLQKAQEATSWLFPGVKAVEALGQRIATAPTQLMAAGVRSLLQGRDANITESLKEGVVEGKFPSMQDWFTPQAIAAKEKEYQEMREFADKQGGIAGALMKPRISPEMATEGLNFIASAIPLEAGVAATKLLGKSKNLEGIQGAGDRATYQTARQADSTPLPPQEQGLLSNSDSLPSTQASPLLQGETSQVGLQNGLSSGLESSSANILVPQETAVNKIINALKEAKPLRGEQEALYTQERAKRFAQLEDAARVGGEAGYVEQLKALKGELPKLKFEGIRNDLTQADIDSLFNQVQGSQLSNIEKVAAKNGLSKLMGAEGGAIPTNSEINLLQEVFPKEFIEAVVEKRPMMSHVWNGAAEALNLPRAMMASFDLSAPLRQGVFMVNRPKQFIPAFGKMFQYALDEKAYQNFYNELRARPSYNLMRESGLSITDIHKTLAGKEERFMSNLAEKIPVIGKFVRGSDRAYTGFINKLRADVFDDLVGQAQKLGLDVNPGSKTLNDISRFINTATGRGGLGTLEKASVALNSTFFSPRLMASRLQLMNPVFYARLDPFVRKEALKSLFGFAGVASTVIGLAKMGGLEVGADPRSSDWGKIKVGNTRLDMMGGFQQYIRLAAQLITNTAVNSTTGVEMTLGEGYRPLTRKDIILRFLGTKASPVASFVADWLANSNTSGNKFQLLPKKLTAKEISNSAILSRLLPMVWQDTVEVLQEHGLVKGAALAVPGFFGVGLQNYSKTPLDIVRSTSTVEAKAKELLKIGDTKTAKELLLRNKDLLMEGQMLKPSQEVISKLTSVKDVVDRHESMTKERKDVMSDMLEKQIEAVEEKQKEFYELIKQRKLKAGS